jgi:hypothetical protein
MFSIFIGWPIEEFYRVRSDIAGNFMRVLDLVPRLAERVRIGRREERFYGTGDVPNFFRKPYGPGWALVGDAGCHKDPFTALGICDAFRDAELLANAVDEGLSGKRLIEETMAHYEKRRNEASAIDYQRNIDFARFQSSPTGDLSASRCPKRKSERHQSHSNPCKRERDTQWHRKRRGETQPKSDQSRFGVHRNVAYNEECDRAIQGVFAGASV